jgi:hypothetical protein
MRITVTGISPEPFLPLYGLSDAQLAAKRARRIVADGPGYPERIELRDAAPGETLLLVNYEHQPAETPFKASHAIYIREGAIQAASVAGLPPVLRRRLLSLRGFSADGMLLDADVADGEGAEPVIERLFANHAIDYIHAHAARPGCYLARLDRA